MIFHIKEEDNITNLLLAQFLKGKIYDIIDKKQKLCRILAAGGLV
jgi:hypothetical protein